jgi:mannosyltransferase OCH1-like enzyme
VRRFGFNLATGAMLTSTLSYTADLIRAAATLELPLRSVEDCYTSVPPSAEGIPNVVYQTWLAPRLGRRHAASLRRFRAMNPEFSFEFFDSGAIKRYMGERYAGEPILEVFRNCVEGPAQTDIWRYCVLFDRGGWYFDISKMIDVPLGRFTGAGTRGLIAMEDNPYPGELSERALERFGSRSLVLNWGLAFEAGHPVLRRTIDSIVAAYPEQKGVRQSELKYAIVQFTGPHRLTRAVAEAIDAGEDDGLTIAGTSFDGHGNHRMSGSWVRYLQRSSYRKEREVVMVR